MAQALRRWDEKQYTEISYKQASTQHEQRIFPLLYAPIMHEHKRWLKKLGKFTCGMGRRIFCIKTNSLLIN